MREAILSYMREARDENNDHFMLFSKAFCYPKCDLELSNSFCNYESVPLFIFLLFYYEGSSMQD